MFGLGDTELMLIIIFAFLLFGPDKLPSMGRTIGRGIKQFRQASDSVTKVVKTEVLNPLTDAAKTEAGTPAARIGEPAAELPQTRERPTETFAERRARLAREREEREAAAAAEAALGVEASAAEMSETVPVSEGTTPVAEETAKAVGTAAPETVETPEVEVPVRASVASMWGLDEGGAPATVGAPVERGEEDAAVRSA